MATWRGSGSFNWPRAGRRFSWPRAGRRFSWQRLITRAVLVVTALAELAVRNGLVKSYLVPAPSSVLRAMIESRAELQQRR